MTEDELKQATCQVIGNDESGTGWLITAGLVLTAYHCVETAARGGEPVIVRFGVGSSASEQTVVVGPHDEDLDICLLQLPTPSASNPYPLTLMVCVRARSGSHLDTRRQSYNWVTSSKAKFSKCCPSACMA